MSFQFTTALITFKRLGYSLRLHYDIKCDESKSVRFVLGCYSESIDVTSGTQRLQALKLIKTFKTPILPSKKFSNQHHFSVIRAQPSRHLFRIKIALLPFSSETSPAAVASSLFPASRHTLSHTIPQVRTPPASSSRAGNNSWDTPRPRHNPVHSGR